MKNRISSFLLFIAAGIPLVDCSSNNRAEHFNKHAASKDSKPDEIIRSLEIKPGQTICDIGSGGGYYSIRFAKETGKDGKVYAVDVKKEFLEYVTGQAQKESITNIITVLAEEKNTGLPGNACDLVFMRDVYHHITDRVEYFRNLKSVLKPGGRIAIIDYKNEGFFFKIIMRHHLTDWKVIIEELTSAGYEMKKEFHFLNRQNFLIFQ